MNYKVEQLIQEANRNPGVWVISDMPIPQYEIDSVITTVTSPTRNEFIVSSLPKAAGYAEDWEAIDSVVAGFHHLMLRYNPPRRDEAPQSGG